MLSERKTKKYITPHVTETTKKTRHYWFNKKGDWFGVSESELICALYSIDEKKYAALFKEIDEG